MSMMACMFPGQGSQEVGMGRDLVTDSVFQRLMGLGSDLLHHDLKETVWRGPDTLLRKASILQTSMAAVCLSYYQRLRDKVSPDVVLGHSLGEIVALGAAGVVSEEESVTIACKRGQLMDQVAESMQGGMMAVLFVPIETVRGLLLELNLGQRVVLANDNGEDQTVLSGETAALDQLARLISERKLGKTQWLPVTGPWHSGFMSQAQKDFQSWIAGYEFRAPSTPMVFNASAQVESDPVRIKSLVTGQLTQPVYWRQCMAALKSRGVDALIEVGSGRVLCGLARVNGFRRGNALYSAGSLTSIAETITALNQQNENRG